MASNEYERVPKDEEEFESSHNPCAICASDDTELAACRPNHRSYLVLFLWLSLIISVSANLFLTWTIISSHSELADDNISRYARLARDQRVVRTSDSPFSSTDRSIQDTAWADTNLETQWAYVALQDSYTESVGLLHSSRWPWDSKKGVYVVTSSHEMHCLHVLRESINEYQDGNTNTSWGYPHEMHCLHVLIHTVMCNADDEPLYTGSLHDQLGSEHPKAGIGATRMCRDWNKLQAWQRQHSACMLPWSPDDPPELTRLTRFTFCPDGEEPWKHSNGTYSAVDLGLTP